MEISVVELSESVRLSGRSLLGVDANGEEEEVLLEDESDDEVEEAGRGEMRGVFLMII